MVPCLLQMLLPQLGNLPVFSPITIEKSHCHTIGNIGNVTTYKHNDLIPNSINDNNNRYITRTTMILAKTIGAIRMDFIDSVNSK